MKVKLIIIDQISVVPGNVEKSEFAFKEAYGLEGVSDHYPEVLPTQRCNLKSQRRRGGAHDVRSVLDDDGEL